MSSLTLPPIPGAIPSDGNSVLGALPSDSNAFFGGVPGILDLDGSTTELRRFLSQQLEEHRKKAEERHLEVLAVLASIKERLPDPVFSPIAPTSFSDSDFMKGAGAIMLDQDQITSVSSGELAQRPSRVRLMMKEERSNREKESLKKQEEEEEVQAPKSWREWVRHRNFDLAVSILIALSVVITFVEQQLLGYEADVELGIVEPGRWGGAMDFVVVCEYVLNALFLIELIIRMSAVGVREFFTSKAHWLSNWFDFAIVIAGCVDCFILRQLSAQTGQNLSVIRLVRLVRVVRTMRAARQLRVLQPLNVLIRTIASSVLSLFWSLVVLGIFHLTAAMMLAQALHHYIMDDTKDIEDRKWVNQMYGSGTKSLYTFFEITYSGGWPAKVRPLVEDVGVGYAIFFVFYITVVFFAIVRIISAMFLKDTLAEAAKDEKWAVEKREEDKLRTAGKIKDLFVRADLSGDGTVSAQEFKEIFSNSQTRTWCELMDFDVSEVDGLFELLDDGDGQLRYQEFVDGMLRLKGPASTRDVLVLDKDCQKIASEFRRLRGLLVELHKASMPGRPVLQPKLKAARTLAH